MMFKSVDTGEWTIIDSIPPVRYYIKVVAVLEQVTEKGFGIKFDIYRRDESDDPWELYIEENTACGNRNSLGYIIPPDVMNVGDKVDCIIIGSKLVAVAKLNKIDEENRIVYLDIATVDDLGKVDSWELSKSKFAIKTNEGYGISSVVAKINSHYIDNSGEIDQFKIEVRNENLIYPYNYESGNFEYIQEDIHICEIELESDEINEEEDCGPYEIKLTNVDKTNTKITIDINVQDEIKQMKKGEADFCKKKIDASMGVCNPYEGQCNGNNECSGGTGVGKINCVTIILDATDIANPITTHSCCPAAKPTSECLAKYSEWISYHNDYDKWKESGYTVTGDNFPDE